MSSVASELKETSISEQPDVVSGGQKDVLLAEFRSLVAKRAYELFEQLGRAAGNDVSHWLRAEGELCARIPEVQQSGSWFTISVALAGLTADHIKVSVEDSGALISAERSTDQNPRNRVAHELASAFYTVRWPESVSPDSASAYLKNGTLTVVARKAGVSDTAAAAPAPAATPGTTEKPRSGSRRGKR